MKATTKLRVSLSFASKSDHKLEDTAGAVAENLYSVAFFDSPPVEKLVLEGASAAFALAIAAQAQGGTAATAEKRSRRAVLVKLLEELAYYVQIKSDNDLAILLSSGFEVVKPGGPRLPLSTPTTPQVKNGISGQILLTVKPVRNAGAYQVDVAPLDEQGTPGVWSTGVIRTSARNIPVDELTPGQLYTFRVRAIGGSTGYSDWSDPVSHRAL